MKIKSFHSTVWINMVDGTTITKQFSDIQSMLIYLTGLRERGFIVEDGR